jgi:hypothetical protein
MELIVDKNKEFLKQIPGHPRIYCKCENTKNYNYIKSIGLEMIKC